MNAPAIHIAAMAAEAWQERATKAEAVTAAMSAFIEAHALSEQTARLCALQDDNAVEKAYFEREDALEALTAALSSNGISMNLLRGALS